MGNETPVNISESFEFRYIRIEIQKLPPNPEIVSDIRNLFRFSEINTELSKP
jgi:hypothetical protein